MSELDRILIQPIIDIKEPIEISSENVEDVVVNIHVILRKCLYCIRQELPIPLETFLFILAQAASFNPDRLCNAMCHVIEGESCVDLFAEVFRHLLSREGAPLRLRFDIEILFEVVHALCSEPKLKSSLGWTIGQSLLSFMLDTSQHSDDCRVHRSCASALITLLRGSFANKNRFKVECGKIAAALERSSDFFFQMQCTEILFRLYVHDSGALAQGQMNDYLRRGISTLHNDATLLRSIQNLLDGYNAEFNVSRILPFTIVRMEVSGTEVCRHTTLYFSSLLVVVMLPGGTGASFSIPFEHIRSVKLSKDHKLGLRLNVIPRELSQVMDLSSGRDTLHVFLTQATLVRLRSSGVHEWIAARKRNAPRRSSALATRFPHSSEAPRVPLAEAAEEKKIHPGEGEKTQPVGEEKTHPVEIADRLGEIHGAAAIKAARARADRLRHHRRACEVLQSELEELQRQNARERDGFEAGFREEMAAIRRVEAEMKACAADRVQSLNAELEEMQALGAALKGEVDRLRERLAKSVGKLEGVEEVCLARVKRLVDSRMEEIEAKMHSLLAESTPLSKVSNALRQYMHGDAGEAAPRAEQLKS
ncbi:unnamed protein product [Phytomonas sp. EM1]|nr:unnamed protein product [Phytomonas sp. EM1]|eukprot:CCW64202.1 unnamed protein product [Phytomonas sp. isolate EM1]